MFKARAALILVLLASALAACDQSSGPAQTPDPIHRGPLGFTQGGGTADVFIGSTPTPTSTPTATPTPDPDTANLWVCGTSCGTGCARSATAVSYNSATDCTLAAAVTAASNGDQILFKSASYGSWTGTNKTITLKVQAGQSASISLSFDNGDQGFTVDGFTVTGLDHANNSTAKNYTVKNSTFTGNSTFAVCDTDNTSILMDNNVYDNIDMAGVGEPEGRIALPGGTNGCGLTVQNSHFQGGCSDGIQTGAKVRILNNQFIGIKQSYPGKDCSSIPGTPHVDSIQPWDGDGSLIKGNFIYDVDDCIMGPDDTSNLTIEDNVCVVQGGQFGFTLGHDINSVINHNTFSTVGSGSGDAIRVYGGNSNSASSGTDITNNVAKSGLGSIAGTGLTNQYNAGSGATGTGSTTTAPTFTGTPSLSVYGGYALTSGSAGHLAGSDGLDMGVRF
jgi:hypothetical protein